jgi:uncharacterized protein YcbX
LTKITSLCIDPIKSVKGISVQEAAVTPLGLEHDREFVLVDEKGFLSQRRLPKMCLIETSIEGNLLTVRAPGADPHFLILEDWYHGEERRVDIWGGIGTGIDRGDETADWFTAVLGISCRLLACNAHNPRMRHSSVLKDDVQLRFADGYPALIISEESLADLNGRLPEQVPMNRFRPNIVVSGCDAPFGEDSWEIIEAGTARLAGAKLCARCAIPMVDQATGQMGKEPMKTLATYRKVMPHQAFGIPSTAVAFGKNFIVLQPGTLRVDDLVVSA